MTVNNERIDLGATDVMPVRDVTVELDEVLFRLVLTWRERQALWYLDLYQIDGTALLKGAAMQPWTLLLTRRQGTQWPGGALVLLAIDGSSTACTLAGLDVTHELVYVPAENIAEWRTEQATPAELSFS